MSSKTEQQDYQNEDPEKRRFEICKDVTAMANASGGYIIIGIREEKKIAKEFCNIDNAAHDVAQRINDICLQYIKPRIPGLKVQERHLTLSRRMGFIIDIDTFIENGLNLLCQY